MKRREGRAKWALRWGATGALLLITLIIVISIAWPHRAVVYFQPTGRMYSANLSNASLSVWATGGHDDGTPTQLVGIDPVAGSHWDLWPPARVFTDRGWGSSRIRADVALWLPWLIFAGAAGITWRSRLRRKPGHCRCGYELVGLSAAKCPECGRALPKSE